MYIILPSTFIISINCIFTLIFRGDRAPYLFSILSSNFVCNISYVVFVCVLYTIYIRTQLLIAILIELFMNPYIKASSNCTSTDT